MDTQQYIVNVDMATKQILGTPVPYTGQQGTTTIVQDNSAAIYMNYGIGFGILILALIALFSTAFTVKQQTVKIVQRLGKFKKVATAGLNFKTPFVERIAGTLDLRVQQITAKVDTKTKDNVFITLLIAVQFSIMPDKAEEAFYKLDDAEEQITAYIFDNVRSQVPTLVLEEVFTSKQTIATSIQKELTDVMSAFGFGITTALVTDIMPDAKVVASMNEVNVQTQLRAAATQKAEGDKVLRIKSAEAEAESKALQGIGIANERKNIIAGLEESAEALSTTTGMDKKDVMSLIMLTQYFDTMKEIGTNNNSKVVFMPSSPQGMTTFADEIRNAIMTGNESK